MPDIIVPPPPALVVKARELGLRCARVLNESRGCFTVDCDVLGTLTVQVVDVVFPPGTIDLGTSSGSISTGCCTDTTVGSGCDSVCGGGVPSLLQVNVFDDCTDPAAHSMTWNGSIWESEEFSYGGHTWLYWL